MIFLLSADTSHFPLGKIMRRDNLIWITESNNERQLTQQRGSKTKGWKEQRRKVIIVIMGCIHWIQTSVYSLSSK